MGMGTSGDHRNALVGVAVVSFASAKAPLPTRALLAGLVVLGVAIPVRTWTRGNRSPRRC